MKIVFAILGGILLAQSCVTTTDARQHNNRPILGRNVSYYADYNFGPSQRTVRGLENCSVWGHYIYPCE